MGGRSTSGTSDPAGYMQTSASGRTSTSAGRSVPPIPGMQVKSAAGGDSWNVAADGGGTVLGAEGAQVRQQLQNILMISPGWTVTRNGRPGWTGPACDRRLSPGSGVRGLHPPHRAGAG